MQYPNNDMDELFRKAAEAYPLNTSTANWEKVHALLAKEEEQEQPPTKGRLRWLLVLLPFTLIGLRLNESYLSGRLQATTRMESAAQEVAVHNSKGKTGLTQPVVTNEKTPVASHENPVSRRPAVVEWLPRSRAFGLTTAFQRQQSLWNDATPDESEPLVTPRIQDNAITMQDWETARVTHEPVLPVLTEASPAREFSIDSLPATTTKQEEQKPKRSGSWKQRLYAGVVAGPDISTVKFHKFSNAGFQAGVLVGYQFNDRFAVEASVLSAKKYYSSEGEYYKPEGTYTPGYAKIVAVDGNCRMIEIPVSIRYSFSRQKGQRWFATAGVSSYLMQRENYHLDYLYPSSGNISTHHYTYTDKDKYWLAALQLSVGYSSRFNRYANFRIEPYYALPLKGMGHGRMPVSSFGVRVGLTVPQF